VAAEGSFAKAGERLGIGRSAVSRNVQKLEAQLDARLLLRTTRCTQLTREGQLFYEHCRPGIEQIAQALDEMRELHSGPPDFAAGRIDVAFRDGILEDSQLIARRLMPMRLLVCASPAYASRHGLPRELVELTAHRCIGLRGAAGSVEAWTFRVEGGVRRVVPEARHGFNDPELAMQAALDGEGLAQLPAYLACEALREGRLLACLGAFADEDRGHYLCYPSRKH
ncbi:LysR family transcriptional regulator, partial [Burkholderia anthina]|uniref:LysR family transcriptional regulator n=1 Tax=Burkholderia anthina TaxID=179879 RepID=UPI00158CF740